MEKSIEFFDKYITVDGLHPIEDEGYRPPFARESIPSTQRIYHFPNGFGASIIRGWFTQNLYEIMVCKFEGNQHSIIGDYIRCDNFEDLARYLSYIYQFGELLYVEE